eukprot:Skav221716  [mRNA]  locus=scaffold542:153297:154315:- [translate_table: standard]
MLVCSCLDLHELLDQEEHFSEHDELEDMFNHYPPRVRMISSLEYDPDNDDYEMQVMPQLPEQIEVEQNQLIEKQIARLQQRIDLGGAWLSEWTCFKSWLHIREWMSKWMSIGCLLDVSFECLTSAGIMQVAASRSLCQCPHGQIWTGDHYREVHRIQKKYGAATGRALD